MEVVIEDVALTDPRLDLSAVQAWFDSACDLRSHQFARAVVAFARIDRPIGALLYTDRFDFSRAVAPAFRRRGIAAMLLTAFVSYWGAHRLTCASVHPWMWPKLEAFGFRPDYSRHSAGPARLFVRTP